jgi:hypothetical protein
MDVIQIDTSDMTSADVASRILKTVRDPMGAGLDPLSNQGVREWKRQPPPNVIHEKKIRIMNTGQTLAQSISFIAIWKAQ